MDPKKEREITIQSALKASRLQQLEPVAFDPSWSMLEAALAAARIPRGGVHIDGDVSVGGMVLSVRGLLPRLLAAAKAGAIEAIVPKACLEEASLAWLAGNRIIPIYGVSTLAETAAWLQMRLDRATAPVDPDEPVGWEDLAPPPAVQHLARQDARLCLCGPPGAGATYTARRLASLLPPITSEERVETACIHSEAGLTPSRRIGRPFRAPHHTVSDAGLVGGRKPFRPGEVSLAHNGVLFLDQLPEFRLSALEALQHALNASECGGFPARPAIVAASATLCPCGREGSPWTAGGTRTCQCSPAARGKHSERLSRALAILGMREVRL